MSDGNFSKRFRGAARVVGIRRALKTGMRWLGFDLVKRHFYSPVPDLAALDDGFWNRRSDLTGIAWDPDAQLEFIRSELSPFIAEFEAPRSLPPGETGFYLENGTYGPVDAELLWAIVRREKPSRVIEVGSGFSSLVIGRALEANRAEGSLANYEIIDPFPGSASHEMGGEDALREIATLDKTSITDIPIERFADLGEGDILFVDATHAVKIGGDVIRVVLDIVPTLAPGVTIQFHDVFLPHEYPRDWVVEQEWYWAEQYLLQAFLAFNDSFEVLVAANMLSRDRAGELSELIPSSTSGPPPLALWIRRRS